ncbi:cation-transporting P-type ATPase [Candidatus Peregrinibacteria bacterium]|nr:MAG: cation-transporting P-type ATPase [Candidatus Peregrinibacteria bacterium]
MAEWIIHEVTTVTNQDNCVFMGATVASGNAYALVYGTGMNTAIGRIAKTSDQIETGLSPLQRELNELAKMLTKIAGMIAMGLFVVNLLLTTHADTGWFNAIQLSILFAISVAAACIPQGLPAQISVALSLGVGRMAKKKAVVKKLSAVETLGSTTLIASDKTGTLTQNEMTITQVYLIDREYHVTGIGYEPKGSFLDPKGKVVDAKTLLTFKGVFQDGFLASNGRVNPPDQNHANWYALGDPTEAAFCTVLMKAGLDPNEREDHFERLAEYTFDSVRKRMTIVRKHKGKVIGYMKGAVETVLAVCSQVNLNGQLKPLDESLRQQILNKAQEYSAQALRVIALAYRDFPNEGAVNDAQPPDAVESQFVFAGLMAMIDPPRTGVKEAIDAAYRAHIKVMIITGDNAETAYAIGKQIGLKNGESDLPMYTGDDIKRKTDEQLKALTHHRSVIFARVSPDDKYRLVRVFGEMGHVVAVTGDGVNDTLSLKKADIGIAMGKMGSEVAKEAAEMIILDDHFATIVSAIKEGRTIFKNLKKTILSSITSNNGELVCVLFGFVGIAFGLPAPITAVQILAVDLVGEMLPLTALTFDPGDKDLMSEEPRKLDEHIINRHSIMNLIFYGFWMGAAGFFAFIMVYTRGTGTTEAARAAAYSAIILCQFMNILSRRTNRTIFTGYLLTNGFLWGSFLISIAAVAALIYLPSIAIWFGFAPMSLNDWLYPVIGAAVFLAWHELRKGIEKIKD